MKCCLQNLCEQKYFVRFRIELWFNRIFCTVLVKLHSDGSNVFRLGCSLWDFFFPTFGWGCVLTEIILYVFGSVLLLKNFFCQVAYWQKLVYLHIGLCLIDFFCWVLVEFHIDGNSIVLFGSSCGSMIFFFLVSFGSSCSCMLTESFLCGSDLIIVWRNFSPCSARLQY